MPLMLPIIPGSAGVPEPFTPKASPWQVNGALDLNGNLDCYGIQAVSQIPNSPNQIAHTLDTLNSISDNSVRLLSVKNATTEKFYIDRYGSVGTPGSLMRLGINAFMGGSLVGFQCGTTTIQVTTQGQAIGYLDSNRWWVTRPIETSVATVPTATPLMSGITFDSGNGSVIVGNVVRQSGSSRTVIKTNGGNQAGVMVVGVISGSEVRAYRSTVGRVYLTSGVSCTFGDILVSSSTANGEAEVDNTETNPSKIIGYAWESNAGTGGLIDFLCP